MTSGPSLRAAASVLAALALFGASACNDGSPNDEPDTVGAEQDAAEPDVPDNPLPEPAFDDDETVALPLGLVSPPGYDWEVYDSQDDVQPDRPHSHQIARTEAFGCEDYISVMQSAPMVTDDPAAAALEYLISMDSSQHGDPAFLNPLASSDLEVTAVEHSEETVTVHLTGIPVSTDVCQSWQMLKQIETTARAATGAQEAEVLLDDVPLAGQLQLQLDNSSPLTIYSLD